MFVVYSPHHDFAVSRGSTLNAASAQLGCGRDRQPPGQQATIQAGTENLGGGEMRLGNVGERRPA